MTWTIGLSKAQQRRSVSAGLLLVVWDVEIRESRCRFSHFPGIDIETRVSLKGGNERLSVSRDLGRGRRFPESALPIEFSDLGHPFLKALEHHLAEDLYLQLRIGF